MLADFVKETTATTGTTATLSLTAATGFARFADAYVVGTPVEYGIQSGNNRENGIATVAAGNTLTRVRATSKYESGVYTKNPATFLSLAGTSEVFVTAHAGASFPHQSAVLRARNTVVKHVYSGQMAATNKAGYTPAASYIYAFPFKLEVSGAITKIGTITNNGIAASSCRIGLYLQGPNGDIGELLFDSGVLNTTASNTLYLNTVTSTYLASGWYWGCVNTGSTAPELQAHSIGNGYLPLNGSDGTRFSIGVNYAARSIAALPANGAAFPTLTTELLGNIPYYPLIVLEMT